MRWAILISIVFSGCASHVVNSPEFLETYAPPKTFSASQQSCFKATTAALKTLDYKLKSENSELGKIETERRKFSINAKIISAKQTSMAQLEQSDQLWMDVTGNDSSCTVKIMKMRLWSGVEEFEKLQSGGAEWARKNIVESLFKEIGSELK